MRSLYEAAGGHDGLNRLAEAWHHRILDDEVVSHAFSHGFHPQHAERLTAYCAEALGGPAGYSERYGDESSADRGPTSGRRAAGLLRMGDDHDDGPLLVVGR